MIHQRNKSNPGQLNPNVFLLIKRLYSCCRASCQLQEKLGSAACPLETFPCRPGFAGCMRMPSASGWWGNHVMWGSQWATELLDTYECWKSFLLRSRLLKQDADAICLLYLLSSQYVLVLPVRIVTRLSSSYPHRSLITCNTAFFTVCRLSWVLITVLR